jgi:hypothetical protein
MALAEAAERQAGGGPGAAPHPEVIVGGSSTKRHNDYACQILVNLELHPFTR